MSIQNQSQLANGNNRETNNSVASFKDVPVSQKIPDEFEYQYGAMDSKRQHDQQMQHNGGSLSSRDFVLLRDQEPSYIFNEHPSMYSRGDTPSVIADEIDTAQWHKNSVNNLR